MNLKHFFQFAKKANEGDHVQLYMVTYNDLEIWVEVEGMVIVVTMYKYLSREYKWSCDYSLELLTAIVSKYDSRIRDYHFNNTIR